MRANTVTAQSVSESLENRQQRNVSHRASLGTSRQERRSNLSVEVGQAFNPFSLFDGALVPSEILRSRDLLPSEKLVFARLLQFAGGNGKAWPSIERVADEVALSVPQARRCISSLESKGSSGESHVRGTRTNSNSCGMATTSPIGNPDHR